MLQGSQEAGSVCRVRGPPEVCAGEKQGPQDAAGADTCFPSKDPVPHSPPCEHAWNQPGHKLWSLCVPQGSTGPHQCSQRQAHETVQAFTTGPDRGLTVEEGSTRVGGEG